MRYIALDLETTGLDPVKDKIIEIGIALFEDGAVINTFSKLINPGIPIPKLTEKLTGINDAMVESAPNIEDIKSEVIEFIGEHPIVGQNISFDINFLNANDINLNNQTMDTFLLARSILPYSESYSLEILAQKLSLKLESAHRALDDAIASLLLMEKLLEILNSQSKNTINKIENFLQNQEWSWKNSILESLKKSSRNGQIVNPLDLMEEKSNQVFSSEKQTIKLEGKKITEGTMNTEQFEFTEKTLIAVPAHIANKFSTNLYRPKYNFLIPEKFEKLLTEERKYENEDEISCVVKLIIWFAHTETFENSEMKIYSKEYKIINEISLGENEQNEIFNKKINSLNKQNSIYITHQNLLKLSILNTHLEIDCNNLIIQDALEFEKNIPKQITTNYYESDFENGEEVFKKIAEIYEINAEEDLRYPEIEINEVMQFSKEFNQLSVLALNSLEKNQNSTKLKLLKNAFENANHYQWQIYKSEEYGTSLKISPSEILSVLKNKIWDKFENCIINDESVETKNVNFIKNALLLDNFETKITQSPKVNYIYIQNFPDTKSRDFIENSMEIIQDFISSENNTLVITPSASMIGGCLEHLTKYENMIRVFAQGISGSNGKIKQMLNSEKGNCIIATQEFSLELIEILKEKNIKQIDVFILKLAYLHPENKYLKYISKFYSNPFEEYALPRAVCNAKKIAKKYNASFESVKIGVLDRRYDFS